MDDFLVVELLPNHAILRLVRIQTLLQPTPTLGLPEATIPVLLLVVDELKQDS